MSVKITKDGRTLRKGRDYTLFRRDLWLFQDGECSNCHAKTSLVADFDLDYSFHVHHKNGRGMGGSKRDDTVEACIGLCRSCHDETHKHPLRAKVSS